MKKFENYKILKNKKITSDIYDMTVLCPEIAEQSKAGQFVNVYLDKGEHLLPRPLSICEIDRQNGTLRLVYRIVGKGTEYLSKCKKGGKIRLLGPLGNCFETEEAQKRIAVIGGGIGTPPLLELVRQIKGGNPACEIYAFLGFRTEPVLAEDFEKYGAVVHVSTDDGSAGFHGNVVENMDNFSFDYDVMYACGPNIMLESAADWARARKTKLYVSMEERMACGIGACVGCAVKIKSGYSFVYKKVCKDGAVFLAEEVCFE